jgi:hypothetical protein
MGTTEIVIEQRFTDLGEELEFKAEAITVRDGISAERARGVIKDLVGLRKDLEANCDRFLNPVKDAYNAVRAEKKSIVDPVKAAEEKIRDKLNAWLNEVAAEERKQAKAIAEAAGADIRDVQIPSAVAKGSRTDKVPEVVDIAKVPAAFLTVDMKKVKAHYRTYPDTPIPGIVLKEVKRAVI